MLPLLIALLTATEPGLSASELLRRGDRLADAGEYAKALLSYKDAYEILLPRLRGLAFEAPVKPDVMSRGQLEKHLIGTLAEEVSDAELELANRSLLLFGFVSEPVDLGALFVRLYTEEIAGFYDSKTKQLVLVEDSEPTAQDDLLKKLFGGGGEQGFDKEGQKMVLSHEMVHALDDQHFGLEALHEATQGDEDMALALSALIEGEATLMMLVGVDPSDAHPDELFSRSPESMASFFGLFETFVPMLSSGAFDDAPEVVQKGMLFPYMQGAIFVLTLGHGVGWSPINAAFRDPPLSTEQILHPDKYLGERDDPVKLVVGDLSKAVGPRWRHVGGEVLGQLQLAVLLGIPPRGEAAAGWDGDRYAVWVHEDGRDALVWLTTWDSEVDAQQFAGAYVARQQTKVLARGRPSRDPTSAGLTWVVDGAAFSIERRGVDVAVVEGLPVEATRRVVDALFGAKRQAKVYPRREKAD